MMKFIYRASARASLCAVLFLSAAGAFGASTYYVATTGDDGAAGTADAPWATVTHALEVAQDEDIVRVGAGTFEISVPVVSKKNVPITKGIVFIGEGEDGTTLNATMNIPMEAEGLVFSGMKLTKSSGNFCGYTLTSGTISNCLVTGCSPQSSTFNTALNLMGGLLVDCRVTNNKAANGHAYPSYSGGSSCNAGGSAVIRNCLFTGNYTTLGASSGFDAYPAGALCIWPAAGNTVTLENCTFAKNTGGVTGAVIFGGRGKTLAGNVVLRGCVLAGNKAPMHPGDSSGNCSADLAVYPGKGTITMENCLIGDKPDNFDALVSATGCTFGAPGFIDEFNGDYTLAAGSPRYGYGYHAGTRGAAFSCAVETPATDRAIASLALTLKALTFNAPEGAASYEWDFDGDGTYDETTDASSVAHTFATPGWNKVGLRVTVGGETAVQPAANLVYVAPAVIYVCPYKKNTTGNEIFPYDTPYNAAKLVSTALKAAIPGSRIEVAAGTYSDSGMTISDVTIAGAGRTTTIVKSLQMRFYANARAENVQLHGTGSNNPVMTLAADSAGLSNCWLTAWKHTTGGTPGGSYLAGTVDGCLFTGCYCNGGSGVFSFSGTVKARNNVFTGNYFGGAALDHYGVVYLSGDAQFENNVVYGNHAVAVTTAGKVSESAGIYVSGGQPTIRNCVVRGNMKDGTLATGTEANWCLATTAKPTVEYCNTPDLPDAGPTIQTDIPKFVDPDNTTAANRDFRLQADSPCIDAGLYQPWQKTAGDAAGNARFQGYGVDIGAYEVEKDTPALGIATDKAKYYGAQEVTFAAASTNGVAMAPDTTYLWTVNGVEQDESSATLVKYLETGAAAVSVVSRKCAYFSAETEVVVHEVPGVDFEMDEIVGVGKKAVTFTPRGTGGLVIDDAATYAWYVNDETGAGEPVSTERTPTLEFNEPGVYGVLLKVSNADGAGAAFEKYRPEGVIVEPLGVDVALSETTGEGRTLITMTATPTGFEPDAAATYEWRWTNLGSATPELTGNPVTGTFRAGTWSVQAVIANADGAGLAVTNTLVDAVTIAPGADFYVSASGDDGAAGTKASPFKTFRNALAHSSAGAKIRIVGLLKEDFNNSGKTGVPIANVEVYGDDWTKDGVTVSSTSADNCFVFGEGAFVHGLKLTGSRAAGGVIRTVADSTVVSNCWITGNYYSSGGNPAGIYTAGLITHVLFTNNRNDNSNGTLMSLSGTAVMRNCVFTGNNIKSNLRGALNGVITLAGTAAMENCVVYGNTSAASPGGDAYAANCRPRNGGGIYIPSGSPTLRNCIVRNNKKPPEPSDGKYPTETGEDIYSATEESDFYILEAASPVIENCNIFAGQVPDGATNCQTANPGFAKPDESASENRDFSLQAGSPCIDAGLVRTWQLTATDYVGNPRVMGWGVDIGAYEREAKILSYDFVAAKTVVTGAQAVRFDVTGDVDEIPDGAEIVWYVDRVAQPQKGASVELDLEVGTHDIKVDMDGRFTIQKSGYVTVKPIPGCKVILSAVVGEAPKTIALKAEATGFTFSDQAVYKWFWTNDGSGEPDATVNPVVRDFGAGTYDVVFQVENADGEGASFTVRKPGAFTVYPHEEPVVPSGNGGKRVYVDQLAGISFKTVNGRPLAGTGALALTAADGYRAVEDVGDYGAVGDGRTDDTAAITAAIEAAYASGKPLYFPRTGCGSTYLTRKGLVLLDNLTITSDPGVVLANASAVLEGGGQTLSTFLLEPVAKGQTTCHVGSVAGFKVGQEVTIYRDGDGSYTETLADIAAIDAERNILTIDVSPYRASGTNEGFLNAYKAGTLVMTDFALVKSLRTKSAVNCTVENLTLRAYGNERDPYVYSISPFHQAAVGGQRSLHLRNVTVDGSNHDGISTQGSGDIWIEGCTVKDIRHKGIHWGTSCDRLTVRNCLCLRCGSTEYEKTSDNGGTGAMYFCYNNHRMLIEGNRMVDCYKGIFGFDYRDASGGIDSDSVIVNNVFDNCTLYGFSTYAYGGSGNHLVLTGNVFTRFGGASVPIDALSLCGATVTDNVIGGFKSDWTGLADHANAAILVRGSPSLVVRGNRIEKGDIKVVGSKNTLVSGNVLDAGRVDDSSGDNENLVKVDNVEGGNK